MARAKTPLKMIALRMFRGGLAVEGALRASWAGSSTVKGDKDVVDMTVRWVNRKRIFLGELTKDKDDANKITAVKV